MALILPILLLAWLLHAQAPAAGPPALQALAPMAIQAPVFETGSARRPRVIRSQAEAAAYFAAEDLARLSREVDFSRQSVLLFAWKGSGQDSLEAVLDGAAVRFTYIPGRTRDLREHHRVFVLRSDLAWSLQ